MGPRIEIRGDPRLAAEARRTRSASMGPRIEIRGDEITDAQRRGDRKSTRLNSSHYS